MPEILLFVYLFALFSVVGWFLEAAYRSITQRRPVNPGFLAGPYLPLYGNSVLALTFCIIYVNNGFLEASVTDLVTRTAPLLDENSRLIVAYGAIILLKAVLYSFVTTGIEFMTGCFFGRFLRRPLWDYTGQKLCIGGSVCLEYSCLWVALAFLYEYVVFPAALTLGLSFDPDLVFSLSSAVCLIMLFDLLIQAERTIKEGRAASLAWKEENQREFAAIVNPLLEKDEVKSLANFKHHLSKTRLDHSMEVAWLSYVVSKQLSWDYASATRGALLHDLFHYDWATEGPRFHGFRHPRICLKNAEKITDLNERERNTIQRHMWPLTVVPPRYPEAWSVCLADTYYGLKDFAEALRHFRKTVNGEGKGRQ
jgi:uncharacterized protein